MTTYGEQVDTPRSRTTTKLPLTVFRIVRRYPIIPLAIIIALLFVAIFAPMLQPHSPRKTSIRDRHTPPIWSAEGNSKYILGTDALGRDILSRIIAGARVSVVVVVVSVSVAVCVGTALGLVAGYFGGFADEVIMRVVDIWIIIPQLLLILLAAVVFGPSFTLLIILLALISWPGAVRLVRAQTLSLRELDYVTAAKVSGASTVRILWRHILPGVINIVVVSATLGVGGIILTEATLSFLGAGVPPPSPTWGNMVADGRPYLSTAWWVAFLPGLCIALVVGAGNFLGDWLRDYFDPTLRQL